MAICGGNSPKAALKTPIRLVAYSNLKDAFIGAGAPYYSLNPPLPGLAFLRLFASVLFAFSYVLLLFFPIAGWPPLFSRPWLPWRYFTFATFFPRWFLPWLDYGSSPVWAWQVSRSGAIWLRRDGLFLPCDYRSPYGPSSLFHLLFRHGFGPLVGELPLLSGRLEHG